MKQWGGTPGHTSEPKALRWNFLEELELFFAFEGKRGPNIYLISKCQQKKLRSNKPSVSKCQYVQMVSLPEVPPEESMEQSFLQLLQLLWSKKGHDFWQCMPSALLPELIDKSLFLLLIDEFQVSPTKLQILFSIYSSKLNPRIKGEKV